MDVSSSTARCPYLRSCKKECENPIEGELKGQIPTWLKGSLVRIGSGLLEIGTEKFNHVFDGMALMHRFSFRDGNVTYQNRFLRSDSYRKNTSANRIIVAELGTAGAPDPCKTIFQRLSSFFTMEDMTDNDLVNIVTYANEAFACSETNNIWQINTETLESIKKVNIRKFLPVDGATAHAHEDIDGTVYNIGSSYGLCSSYNIIKFPLKGDNGTNPFQNGSVISKIPASRFFYPSYYHSFAMTENYFIMVEQPLYISVPRMIWIYLRNKSYDGALYWNPNIKSRFHVVRRSDGQILKTKYVAECFFLFHHINAYEENSHLVIDVCAYERGEILNVMYVKALEDLFNNPAKTRPIEWYSTARRYVLPLNVGKSEKNPEKNLISLSSSEATAYMQQDGSILCNYELLTGSETWSPELPRINYENYNGRKYRYFYCIAHSGASLLENNHLLKVDTEAKTTLSWTETKTIPSEPVFLAGPSSVNQDEDSGVLLASLLYEDDESKVSLIVLDAKTMQELGRVTFKTNSSVPGDFHGVFFRKT